MCSTLQRMKSKTRMIADMLDAGNDRKALSIAAKFFDRSDDTNLFKRAQSAVNNPQLYAQMKIDPEALYLQAVHRLRERFGNAAS